MMNNCFSSRENSGNYGNFSRNRQNGMRQAVPKLINFDNAATTFPKPSSVLEAMDVALRRYGGNPGRGGHRLSMETAEAVFRARERCGGFFGVKPENTVFTLNCTHALNQAMYGVMADPCNDGQYCGHMIISCLEHNSVSRPAFALEKKGCEVSVAKVYPDDLQTLSSFASLFRADTRLVACTMASNVTGQRLPVQAIGKLCRERGVCFICDGAQGCGVLPVNLNDQFIDVLCTAGHKGLYGPAGTGLLLSNGRYPMVPLMQGGTGTTSLEMEQPDFLPDGLESGTINTCGAIALGAGVDFVQKLGVNKIFAHETELCDLFLKGLKQISGAVVYRHPGASYAPIVSFNLSGYQPVELGELLAQKGFCMRGGIHCAGLTHRYLGTDPNGTLRFSPSIFNTHRQVWELLEHLRMAAVKKS